MVSPSLVFVLLNLSCKNDTNNRHDCTHYATVSSFWSKISTDHISFPVSFTSFTCPLSWDPHVQSVASISIGKAPVLTQTITVVLGASRCLRVFSSLVQAVGNVRLKYSHSTSHVWLTQHVSPGWKGCALPEGTQAACQPWDLPLCISDSFRDGTHQGSVNSALWNECLVLSVYMTAYILKSRTFYLIHHVDCCASWKHKGNTIVIIYPLLC